MLVAQSPNLRQLCLYWNVHITDTPLYKVASLCTQLTHLNLSVCKRITDEGLTAVASKCHELIDVDLTRYSPFQKALKSTFYLIGYTSIATCTQTAFLATVMLCIKPWQGCYTHNSTYRKEVENVSLRAGDLPKLRSAVHCTRIYMPTHAVSASTIPTRHLASIRAALLKCYMLNYGRSAGVCSCMPRCCARFSAIHFMPAG